MKVSRGGSAEGANKRWIKFDVELDESDIQAEVMKYELDRDALTVFQKYTLLVNLAELMVVLRMEALGAASDVPSAALTQKYRDYVAGLPRINDLK